MDEAPEALVQRTPEPGAQAAASRPVPAQGAPPIAVDLDGTLVRTDLLVESVVLLVKRYAELMAMRTVEGARARARGYQLDDAELLAALGGAAGYLAVLVLALYIESASSHLIYGHPRLLWALCVLLLYWVSHLWLMAHRRRMHDDPLVFAVRDPVSRVLLVLMAGVLLAAA